MTIELRRCLGVLALLCVMVLGSTGRAEAQLAIPACPTPATIGLGLVDGVPLIATGGTSSQSDWTLAAGTLPPGLSIRTDRPEYVTDPNASAILAGVAITPGTWGFTLQVTNNGVTATRACTISVSSLVFKDARVVPKAFVGSGFSHTLTALRTGNIVSPTWSVDPLTPLPPGIQLDASTGLLSGTPAASGVTSVTLLASESGETVSRNLTFNVFDIQITTSGTLPNAIQGLPYMTSISADGGTGPYTFSASGLPFGLTMSTNGTISGVTTQRGPWTISVIAIDSQQRSQIKVMSLDVVGNPKALPMIAPYRNALDDCSFGTACSRGVGVSGGGTAPFTWSASGLPPGMSIRAGGAADASPDFSPKDAEIWGVSTQLGTYDVTVTVTDVDGATATNTFPLTISELALVNASFTQWTLNVTGQQRLRVLGGASRPVPLAAAPDGTIHTAALVGGAPPAGVGLGLGAGCAASIDFCGTPVENIATSARVQFTDPEGKQLEATYFFNVDGGSSTIQIGGASNLGTIPSGSGYTRTLFACCAASPLVWSIVGGTLPPGVGLSAGGVLSGIIPAGTLGTFTFLVKAAASADLANSGVKQFVLSVVGNAITTATTLPAGNVGTAAQYSIQSVLPGAWSLTGGLLPPGFTFPSCANSVSCLLLSPVGGPTATGQYSFAITNSNGPVTAVFNLSIGPASANTLSLALSNQSMTLGSNTLQLIPTGGSGTGYHVSVTPWADTVPGFRVQDGGPLPTFWPASAIGGFVGVATVPGVWSTSIRVTDSAGNIFDRPFSITVSPLHLLSQTTPPRGRVNQGYVLDLGPSAFGGVPGSYVWSAVNLPTGLTINAATGVISGTPTVASSFSSTVVLKSGPHTTSVPLTLIINPFEITSGGVLPAGTVGTPYTGVQLFAESNCGAGCTWSVSGAPAGFALSGGGVFSNTNAGATPTGVLNSNFTIQATGSAGTVQKVFSLRVLPSSPQVLQLTSPNQAATSASSFLTLGQVTSVRLDAVGGTEPYTWTLDAGTLPPGLSIQGTGELLGSLLAPGYMYIAGRPMQTGVYTFTLKVTDSIGSAAVRAFTWTVSELSNQYFRLPPTPSNSTIPVDLPFTTGNRLFAIGGSATEGTGDYTWTALTPLPYGLTLDSSTGVVTGTPLELSITSFPIRITDNGTGASVISNVTFNVTGSSPIAFSTGAALGTIQQGQTLTRRLDLVVGGNTANACPTCLVTAETPLPPGLTLLHGAIAFNQTGLFLTGQPLQSGTFSFVVRAQDTLGNITRRTFTVTVSGLTFGVNTNLPDSAVGEPYTHSLLTWNNTGSVSWAIAPGSSLPPGLSLIGNVLAGVPTAASGSSNFSFQLVATDAAQPAGAITLTLSLRIGNVRITSPQVVPVEGVIGSPFSYQFTCAECGTPGAVTWTHAGGLSASFSLSDSGLLSADSVETAATLFFQVTATPTSGGTPVTRRFTLYNRWPNRLPLDFGLAGTQLADATVGSLTTQALNPTGGAPPYAWSVAPGATLPPGLALVHAGSQGAPSANNLFPGTTYLTGTPTTVGSYTFDLILSDSAGAQNRRTFTLRVSPIGILGLALKIAVADTPYAQQMTPIGVAGGYTFTMNPVGPLQPMLPPGLSMSASGLISGSPTSAGVHAFFLTLTDTATGNTFTRRFNLIVARAADASAQGQARNLYVSNFNPPDWSIGVGRRNMVLSVATVNASNGGFGNFPPSNYVWSLVSGSLPPGVLLVYGEPLADNPTETRLAGHPTGTGTFTFTLRATDTVAPFDYAEHTFTMRVSPMQLVTPPTEAYVAPDLPRGVVGQSYTTTLKVAGGTPPYQFSQSTFAPLPPGISLGANGVLAGAPTSAGTFSIQPIVTDANGTVALPPLSLTVYPSGVARALLPFSTDPDLWDGSVGVPYNFPLDTTLRGGTPPFAWSVAPGSTLPPGFEIRSGSNGVSDYLAGLPLTDTGEDAHHFSLVASDGDGQMLTLRFRLHVGALALTPDTLPPARVGSPYTAVMTPSGGTPPYTVLAHPQLNFPPGLTLDPSGLLTGIPTHPGNFAAALYITDASGLRLYRLYRFVVDNAAGEAPAVSLAPTPIQLFYTVNSANPAPIPISVNATSGSFAFGLAVEGLPNATLSVETGAAPAVSNLTLDLQNVDLSGVTLPHTYYGVIGVRADSVNLLDQIPVSVTIAAQPPCTYSVGPTAGSIAAAGGAGSFGLTTGAACGWTAVSDAAWLAVDSATSGSGSTTVTYSAAVNPDLGPRLGHVGIGGQTFTVTQFGSSCSFAISPASISAPASGGTAVVTIAASNAACAWTAPDLNASPVSGTGNGTVMVTIPPTAVPSGVIINATIAGQPFVVNQAGAGCSVGLSPLEASSPAARGTGSVNVTPTPTCAYDTIVGPSWVTIVSGGSGAAAGTLIYDVEPNTSTFARSGTLTIGGRSFPITQEGSACSVTLDTSGLGSPYAPDEVRLPGTVAGTLQVSANGGNCAWVASAGAPWVTLSRYSGTGSMPIFIGVMSNEASLSPRSTDITVGGQTIGVTQSGIDCSFSLQSASGSIQGTGGIGTAGVIAPAACGWSAVSNDPGWLTVVSSGGAGTSSVLFSAAVNGTGALRTGTLTIATKTFTVTQPAPSCAFALSPTTATALATGTSPTAAFGYTAAAGCTANPVSFTDWIAVNSVTSSTVVYTVAPNPTTTARVGTIQLGQQTFSVTQAGASCAFRLDGYGSVFGRAGGSSAIVASASSLVCPAPTYGTDQPSVIGLPQISPPMIDGTLTLPFDVAVYNSLNVSVRFARITFSLGGIAQQVHTVKQTSW